MTDPEGLLANGLIVFSDLDGTLLDHDTYRYDAAKPALERLRQAGHALVLASSKTAAEILPLRSELGFGHCPAIVENGAGLLPLHDDKEGGVSEAQTDYQRILELLGGLPKRIRDRFEGFADWSVAEIARRTGLSPAASGLAKQRAFSEPGILTGNEQEKAEFLLALKDLGIITRQGGRFLTLSFGATKASQMTAIIESVIDERRPLTFALGDAQNDVEMLETADRGCIIVNPHATPLPKLSGETQGSICRSSLPGPAGWNTAVLKVADEIKEMSDSVLSGA